MSERERYLLAPMDTRLVPYAEEIVGLAEQLHELDLIDADNPGRLQTRIEHGVWAIEADHPSGPRLYTRDGVDVIVASRMRPDGRLEHAVLDECGLPIEWRTGDPPRPQLSDERARARRGPRPWRKPA